MSFLRTSDRSPNSKVNSLGLRPSGEALSGSGTVSFVGAAAAQTSTTGALSLPWLFGVAVGDLAIIVYQTSGNGASIVLSGWTEFTDSPIVDVASTAGSKLQVLYQRVTTPAPANVSIPGAADHSIARIYIFRNARTSIAPGRASTTSTKTTASPTISWPSIATVAHNSLVVFVASRPDDNASTTFFTFFTNANLTSTTAAGEAGTTSGNGGGFGLFYGTKADPGAIGNATANLAAVVTNGMLVFALEPSVALSL